MRRLVNKGAEVAPIELLTDRGVYFNGVDNCIDTGVMHSLLDSFTWFVDLPLTAGTSHGYIYSANPRLHIEASSSHHCIVGVGSNQSYINFNTGLPSGEVAKMAVSFDKVTKLVEIQVLNSNVSTSFIATLDNTNAYKLFLGARITDGVAANHINGAVGASYFIPKTLTPTQIQAHYNNPEKTLYWDNGTLKSDILDQTTIDSLQAGNGFWYPMTENISAGGYYRNHALPMPISKGDFAGDYSDFTPNNATSIVDGELVYSNTDYGGLNWKYPFENGVDYIVEVDVSHINGGNLRENGTWTALTDGTAGIHRTVLTGDGSSLSIYQDTYDGSVDSIRVKSVKVYPLANSGLTPLTNWTTTTVTNASPTGDGYQTAFVEQDSFGLPTALKKVNAGGITLADTTSEFAQQGLTLINNAGTLQLTKD